MNCNECSGEIKLPDDALEGEIVTCHDCGTSFEIFKKDDGSLDLRSAKVEGEDWGE